MRGGGLDDGGGSLRHRRRGPARPGRLLSARRPGPRLHLSRRRTWPTAWRPRWASAGRRLGISVACASGAIAIALAARMIEEGRARVALAGGSDALSRHHAGGLQRAAGARPPAVPAVLPDAGGAEPRGGGGDAAARGRRARSRAPGTGAGLAQRAGPSATTPSIPPRRTKRAAASRSAWSWRCGRPAWRVEDVGYVNAHGTGHAPQRRRRGEGLRAGLCRTDRSRCPSPRPSRTSATRSGLPVRSRR